MIGLSSCLATFLAASAAWVWMGSSGRSRLPRAQIASQEPAAPATGARSLPMLPAVAVMSVALAVLIGGFVGLLLGVACMVVLPRLIRRLEPAGVRRRRAALERQAPQAADLLAAVLACGGTTAEAVAVVARALGPPLSEDLEQVHRMLALGATPEQAWQALPASHPLSAVGGAFGRSSRSGAALHAALIGIADDLLRRRRLAVEVAARSAGVRAVGPLAACFLPAFVLVGIVPVVASLATRVL